MMKLDEEFDKMMCYSAILVKCLSSDVNTTHVAHCESSCNLKLSKYQVKSFDSVVPVYVFGDIYNFPDEDMSTHMLCIII